MELINIPLPQRLDEALENSINNTYVNGEVFILNSELQDFIALVDSRSNPFEMVWTEFSFHQFKEMHRYADASFYYRKFEAPVSKSFIIAVFPCLYSSMQGYMLVEFVRVDILTAAYVVERKAI